MRGKHGHIIPAEANPVLLTKVWIPALGAKTRALLSNLLLGFGCGSLENLAALRYSEFRERDVVIHLQPRKNVLFLALVFCQVCPSFALEKQPVTEAANLVVTGLLVCLDGSFKETACSTAPETLGLKAAAGGTIYPLKKHENVNALFVEKRLQTREFRLTLRKDEASPWFELVKSQFIRGGKVYDFHYFCEICNITTHAPGICLCCREETEYRERLAQ